MKIRLILLFLAALILIVFSEVVYTYSHPAVLSADTLNLARFMSSHGMTREGFFILTKGQIRLPFDINFTDKIQDYLETVPPEYDLPKVYYDLAILSYSQGMKNLTPGLLKLEINLEPNFGYPRAELANYYLLTGQKDLSKKVLDDCLKAGPPAKNCQVYLDNNFKEGAPQPAGFLKTSVDYSYKAVDD